MERRSFLKAIGGTASAVSWGLEQLLAAEGPVAEADRVAGLPRRLLGRTGQKVSVVAFPGLALIHHDQAQCAAALRAALDKGVNYFDVAPAYGNGECETKMGRGLEGLERSRYFLACKTKKRDKAGAQAELEASLKLLKTDHFDLYQLHHLRAPEDVDQIMAPGGAIEALVAAQKAGKVKYLGFSSHTGSAAAKALQSFAFDTAMLPLNFVERMRHNFAQEALQLAQKQGVGVLAIKALSLGTWAKDAERKRKWWYRSAEEPQDIELVLRYVLSQPAVVAAFTPAFVDLFEKAVEAAKAFRPITPAELQRLQELAQKCLPMFEDEKKVAAQRGTDEALCLNDPHGGYCGREV